MFKNPKLIEVFISTVEKKKNKVYTNYKDLASEINSEFKTDVTEMDIWRYYEPEIEELDVRIHNNSLDIHR